MLYLETLLIRLFASRLLWPLLTSSLSVTVIPFEAYVQASPGTTRFFPSIYLPHLLLLVLGSYWTSSCWATLSPTIAYMRFLRHIAKSFRIRQARGLPLPSFRFHLTMDTLAFCYVFPATGQTPEFHRLEKRAPPGAPTKRL